MSQCTQSVCQDAVRATEQGILVQQKEPSPLLSSVSFNALKTQMEDERLLNTVQPLSREEIQAAQQQDPVIGRMYEYKERNEKPTVQELKGESVEFKALVREWGRLEIRTDGTMYRSTRTKSQLVLPETYRPLILNELHKEMGHLGTERTVNLIRDRFFWPKMQRDVEHFITNVCECLKRKKTNRQ